MLLKKECVVDQINDNLDNLVGRLSAPETAQMIKNWLRFCGQFHQYSFRNQFSLMLQAKRRGANVEKFASFSSWRKMGAFVNKGEKAYSILCPRQFVEYEKDKNGNFVKGPNGKRVPVIDLQTGKPVERIYFVVGGTFDINQTNAKSQGIGQELEYRDQKTVIQWSLISEIEAAVKDYFKIEIEINNSIRGNGAYNVDRHCIEMKKDDNTAAASYLSTMFHEVGHVQMHGEDLKTGKYQDIHNEKGKREGEAEAFSFALASMFGIENQSELYIGSWGTDAKELQKSLTFISKSVKTVAKELSIDDYARRAVAVQEIVEGEKKSDTIPEEKTSDKTAKKQATDLPRGEIAIGEGSLPF